MISTKRLIEKANTLINSGSLTELQLAQLTSITNNLENCKFVVATLNDLPDVTENEGRLIYVVSEEEFYFSAEKISGWTNDFGITSENLLGFGTNNNGMLGDGTTINRSIPTKVVGGITNWSEIAADSDHSLGVTDTGVLYAWGRGADGRLGTGDTNGQSSPVTVVGGITNWSSVAAGSIHSLGVTDTGVLYAWGGGTSWQNQGQLGAGDTNGQSSPVTVVGGITNWNSVAANGFHSLGLTDTGILYAWGYGESGRLGTGDRISQSSPVTVVGGITNWSSVAAGSRHTLGLTDTSVLYAWGEGYSGQSGTGDRTDRSSPVTVVGGITNWSSVFTGGLHSLGLTDTGVLYAWGLGNNGQLGTGDRTDRSSPVTVVGGITNWSLVAAGSTHSLGVTDTGILYAWGEGGGGQLGTNDTIDHSSPVTVVGGITNWSSVAAGSNFNLITGFVK